MRDSYNHFHQALLQVSFKTLQEDFEEKEPGFAPTLVNSVELSSISQDSINTDKNYPQVSSFNQQQGFLNRENIYLRLIELMKSFTQGESTDFLHFLLGNLTQKQLSQLFSYL